MNYVLNNANGIPRAELLTALENSGELQELDVEIIDGDPNLVGGGGLVGCDDVGTASKVDQIVEEIIFEI